MRNLSDDIGLFEGYSYFAKAPIAYGKYSKRSFHIRKNFAKKSYIQNLKNIVISDFDSRDSVIDKNTFIIYEKMDLVDIYAT